MYQVALQGGRPNFHSAQVFFTGLVLAGVLSGRAWRYLPLGAVKLLLYLQRKWMALDAPWRGISGPENRGTVSVVRLLGSAVRVGAGFGIPLGIALTLGGAPPPRRPWPRSRPPWRASGLTVSSSTPSWT